MTHVLEIWLGIATGPMLLAGVVMLLIVWSIVWFSFWVGEKVEDRFGEEAGMATSVALLVSLIFLGLTFSMALDHVKNHPVHQNERR